MVVGSVGFAIPAEDDCDDALKEENDGGGVGSRG